MNLVQPKHPQEDWIRISYHPTEIVKWNCAPYQILQKIGAHVSKPSTGMEVGGMHLKVITVARTQVGQRGKKGVMTRRRIQLP